MGVNNDSANAQTRAASIPVPHSLGTLSAIRTTPFGGKGRACDMPILGAATDTG